MPDIESYTHIATADGTPAAHAPVTERAARYGIRRFLDVNANLLRMLSVLFAAAAFVRAFPSGVASAILLSLIVAMIFLIYWRLWQDLPLHFGIVPGAAWTTELALFYYLFTITVMVAAFYVVGQYFESRHQYLWVAMGTLLALGAVAGLTRRAVGAEQALHWVAWLPAVDEAGRARLAAVIVGALVLLSVPAAYYVAYRFSAPVNVWLDQVLPGYAPPASSVR